MRKGINGLIFTIFILLYLECGREAPLARDEGQFVPLCDNGKPAGIYGCNNDITPCELIEYQGGCPEGYICIEYGCVPGIKCGDKICKPYERCEDGECKGCGSIDECASGEICIDYGVCVNANSDNDGDGYTASEDCNDNNPQINPSKVEVCDGVDNNCDGNIDEGFDRDRDRFTECGSGNQALADCNDNDPEIHPGQVDLCKIDAQGNLIDTDCNPELNSCPPGRGCCPGIEGCVSFLTDPENCGGCGVKCEANEFCILGECSQLYDSDVVPNEGEESIGYQGDALRAKITWNWQKFTRWYNLGTWFAPNWFEYFWYEYSYGITWGEEIGGRGVLLFSGRHFNNCLIYEGIDCPYGWNLPWYPVVILQFTFSVPAELAITPGGDFGYGIAYVDRPGPHSVIFFTTTGRYGYFWNWSTPVTTGRRDAKAPSIAWSPYYYFMGASFGLVYEQGEEERPQVYFKIIDSYWSYWTPWAWEVQLSNDPKSAHFPDIVWTPYGYGVIWIGSQTGDLFYTLIDRWGHYIIPPTQVTHGANLSSVPPALEWNPILEEFAVVYQAADPRNFDNEDIYFARFNLYGVLLGNSPIRLTYDPADQEYPDIVWGINEYGIVFQDSSTGRSEIVFVRISLDGSEITPQDLRLAQITDHSRTGGEAKLPAITFAYHPDFGIGFIGAETTYCKPENGLELCGWGEYAIVWSDALDQSSKHRIRLKRFAKVNRR